MKSTLSAKEVNEALKKTGIEAIPYPDLRQLGKNEYARQKETCKNCSCDKLAASGEITVTRNQAKKCHAQRIEVRTVFKRAIARLEEELKHVDAGAPLRPLIQQLVTLLKKSQATHELAIEEVNKAVLKCEEKLRKIK